jgi:hypothetical protein
MAVMGLERKVSGRAIQIRWDCRAAREIDTWERVRCTPRADIRERTPSLPLRARNGSTVQQKVYSMISSAMADNVGGTSMPSAFAVLMLITSS